MELRQYANRGVNERNVYIQMNTNFVLCLALLHFTIFVRDLGPGACLIT